MGALLPIARDSTGKVGPEFARVRVARNITAADAFGSDYLKTSER
jgi:hypothetical protein